MAKEDTSEKETAEMRGLLDTEMFHWYRCWSYWIIVNFFPGDIGRVWCWLVRTYVGDHPSFFVIVDHIVGVKARPVVILLECTLV
jgi:hypothetical protein